MNMKQSLNVHRDMAHRFAGLLAKTAINGGDLYITTDRSIRLKVRDGKLESFSDNLEQGMGMMVFQDDKQAFVTSTDLTEQGLKNLLDQSLELLKFIQGSDFVKSYTRKNMDNRAKERLKIYDDYVQQADIKREIAYLKGLEKNAITARREIASSQGASLGMSSSLVSFCTSERFFANYRKSIYSVYLSVIASKGKESNSGGDGWAAVYRKGLPSYSAFGRYVARKAVRLLGGTPIKTANLPVLFHPDAGATVLSGIIAALKGDAVLKGSSCFADKLGKKIASAAINIVDNGIMERGVGTAPIDGEGILTSKKYLVRKGVLKTFLLDLHSAQELKAEPTGNAFRGDYSGRPHIGVTNCYLEDGPHDVAELIAAQKRCLYVHNIIGFGIDPVSGTISVGVAGLLIKDGKIENPVSRVTIATTFDHLLNNISHIANDLVFKYELSVPHFLVQDITVSGE